MKNGTKVLYVYELAEARRIVVAYRFGLICTNSE